MKKRIASLALATVMFVGSLPVHGATALKDISDSRYKKAIENIYDKGIMEGDSAETFRPSDSISRAEFAAVVAKWKKLSVTGKASFKDVKGHWAEGYIAAVAKKGWMSGIDEDSFDPNGRIIYRDALKTILSIMGKDGEAIQFGGYPLGYTYIAEKYSLTKNIAGSYEAPIFRGAVAQAIDNAIAIEDGGSQAGDAPNASQVKSQEEVKGLNIKVKKDIDLATAVERLPREALINLKDGSSVFLKIEWNLNSYYNKDAEGTYSISGKIQLPTGITDPDKKISTVYGYIEVVDEEAEFNKKVVNTVGRVQSQTTVSYGTSEASAERALPKEVKLYIVGGGEEMAGISWSIESYDGETSGKYKATGRVVLPSGVVDSLNVLKEIEAELVVDEEETKLRIVGDVEAIDLKTYKIKTNRVIKNILDDTVKIYLLDEDENSLEEYPYESVVHGDGQNEFIVKLKEQFKLGSTYRFEVKDPTLVGDAGKSGKNEGKYTVKSTNERFKISGVVLEDNIVPAGEPMGQVEFKALNKDGEDITGTVRHTVTVKKSWDTTDTTADKEMTITGNTSYGEVRYLYLNYKDAEGKDRSTEQKRIIFQDRKAKSFEDWSLETNSGDLDFEKEKHYIEESDSALGLYINAVDQFGNSGLAKIAKQDIEITVTRGKEYIDGSSLSGDKLRLQVYSGEETFEENPVSNIKLKDPTLGKMIEFKVKLNGTEKVIKIDIEKDAELSGLKFNEEIEKNKNKISLSSSKGLTLLSDRSEDIELIPIDQRGNRILLESETVNYDIASAYKSSYQLRGNKVYRYNPEFTVKNSSKFEDIYIEMTPYGEAIEYVYRMGIINGVSEKLYNPEGEMTREQFAVIISRMMSLEPNNDIAISDDVSTWAIEHVRAAIKANYMELDGGKFYSSNNLPYRDILKIMVSIMGKDEEAKALGGYPSGYISVARKYGITNGINFSPDSYVTRGVLAQVIKNSIEKKYIANEHIATIVDTDKLNKTITPEKVKDAEFDMEFWIEGDEEGEKIGSKNLSVTIVNPGLPKTMFIEGFKKEILDTENMVLNFFEIDSEGIKVKRIGETVDVKLEDMSKAPEDATRKVIDKLVAGDEKITIDQGLLEPNKVYRLTITVEEIEILRDYIAVKSDIN